jgi:hypothetical protein
MRWDALEDDEYAFDWDAGDSTGSEGDLRPESGMLAVRLTNLDPSGDDQRADRRTVGVHAVEWQFAEDDVRPSRQL